MAERVLVTVNDHVAVVTLNRPEKRNALDLATFEALAEIGDRLAADPDVRAVVLSGEGEHFCAGMDVSVFGAGAIEDLDGKMRPREGSPANFFQAAAYTWRELPVPVICALSGNAFGGGLQIALGADIRLASPDTSLSLMEIRWGLVPDMAITATLTRIMPADKIKELALTGRIVDGREAETLGLVTRLCEDPKQAALELAQTIAAKSPDAVRGIKRLLDRSPDMPVAEALRLEAETQLGVMGAPNQVEAVRANMERRDPVFAAPAEGK